MKNYYSILGVAKDADYETIKKVYRGLAKENHPDLHPGDTAKEARFKEIGEAWEVLGDENKRKKYDMELSGNQRRTQPSNKNGKRTAPVGKVDIDEMMKNFSNMFSESKLQNEAEKKTAKKDPFNTDEMFRKFMGIK